MEDKEKEPCGNRALKIIRMIFTDCAKVSMTDMQQATLYRLYFVIGVIISGKEGTYENIYC